MSPPVPPSNRRVATAASLYGKSHLTVIAPVKAGIIAGCVLNETYRYRAESLLKVLHLLRLQQVEAGLHPHPFPDVVARHEAIHSFTVTLLPSKTATEADQVLLDVTFDGGFEPYIRVIWGPLGPTLDAIFCSCLGYPLAHERPFTDYLTWVRAHARQAGLFYLDSGATVSDERVSARRADAVARARPDGDLEAALSRTAAPLQVRSTEPTLHAVETGVRILQALYELRMLFPANADRDDAVLRRFAQYCLSELKDWVAQKRFDAGGEFAAFQATAGEALRWLCPATAAPSAAVAPAAAAESWRGQVQPGIAESYAKDIRHGLMALVGIRDPGRARQWLGQQDFSLLSGCGHPNLAITCRGLERLGIDPEHLAELPQEFVEGMERRAGLLGDVRSNHPQNWQRPRDAHGDAVDLEQVDLVLQLRLQPTSGPVDPATAQARLQEALQAWVAESSGLQVLSTQAMASGERDSLGFVDGVSQPQVADAPGAEPARSRDHVLPGELFHGFPNARDAGSGTASAPSGPRSELLHGASFMVVRKLRIHLDRVTACAEAAAQAAGGGVTAEDVLARMVGRRQDGAALVPGAPAAQGNEFSFRYDKAGLSCPFASHVRRSNPRTENPPLPVPRILRRGMSYGATARDTPAERAQERGLVFVAYNGSIAEQFEVIQRWVAGGNSSGVSSDQDDPLLGVPVEGRSRIFKCFIEGQLVRVDLGDAPLVTLQWGLYAVALAPAALRRLGSLVGPSASVMPSSLPSDPPLVPPDASGAVWRAALESTPTRAAAWAQVARASGPVEAGDYARVVARAADVEAVLRDRGERYSVCGYAQRMAASTGVFHLGLDPQPAAGRPAQPAYAAEVNAVVAAHRSAEAAFDEIRQLAPLAWKGVLARLPSRSGSRTVDLRLWVASVVGLVCRQWFGLPDASEDWMCIRPLPDPDDPKAPPSCPGHFLMLSRSLFVSPAMNEALAAEGRAFGQAIQAACLQWVAQWRASGPTLGPHEDADPQRPARLSLEVMRVLDRHAAPDEDRASTIAGLMLGIAPTLMANAVGVLTHWNDTGELWRLRRLWLDGPGPAGPGRYAAARSLLESSVWSALMVDPVPYAVWRTDVQSQPPRPVAVGLAAAAREGDAHRHLLFGGRYGDATAGAATAHACPGQVMAIGQLLGLATVLMELAGLQRGATAKSLLWVDGGAGAAGAGR